MPHSPPKQIPTLELDRAYARILALPSSYILTFPVADDLGGGGGSGEDTPREINPSHFTQFTLSHAQG